MLNVGGRIQGGDGMTEIMAMLAFVVWVVTVEIRLAKLYAHIDFLEDRVVDVDARTCILEGRKK